jgi:glycosyltransferase involved in cell wall biosynthesis
MKTAYVLPWVSRKAGGVFYCVSDLAKAEGGIDGMQVEVFGSRDEFMTEDLRQWQPVRVHMAPAIGPRRLCWAPALKKRIAEFGPDLVHSATVWTWPAAMINQLHDHKGIPFVVSTHGTLDSWALHHSRWKKAVALRLFQQKHFERAACIHALNESELVSIRAFGLKNPVCVIPNGVEMPDKNGERGDEEKPSFSSTLCHRISGRKMLLYLGRIHPKKGLINLIRAWAAIQKAKVAACPSVDWVLAIAGWDEAGHERELKTLSQQSGVQDSILFLGPRFGREKATLYRSCDAFVLPSFSEGLPMVVLEAWAYGKPVLMTPECNLPEGFAAGAALKLQQGADGAGLALGLRELFQATDSDLQVMGERGHALVLERFSWPKIAQQMKSVHDWVLGGGAPPGCVQFSTHGQTILWTRPHLCT